MARLQLLDVLPDDELLRQLVGPGSRGPVGDVMKQVAATTVAVARRLAEERLNVRSGPGSSYVDKFEINLLTVPRVAIEIKNTAEHALFIEEGTEPHDIFPVAKKVLRFWVPGREDPIFSVHVRHPGTRPYRILSDAVDIAMRRPYKPRF